MSSNASPFLLLIQSLCVCWKNEFTLTLEPWHLVGHQLVKDVVRALGRLLGDNTSLLKEVDLDVSTSKLAGGLEVDSNELALAKRNETWMAL